MTQPTSGPLPEPTRRDEQSAGDAPTGAFGSSSLGAEDSVTAAPIPSDQPPPDLPPELANHPRYEILELLGAGGMGTVYKARHRLMDRIVALKLLRPHLLDRPGMVKRFEREVRMAARLIHPNIVTAYDADMAGRRHFLVMEYVPGTTLAKVVMGEGPLPVRRACEYARQVALGLQHAFHLGMIHRDIKPHNLLLCSAAPVVKILDFGIARLVREAEARLVGEGTANPAAADAAGAGTETDASLVLGTANYMAPEQAEDPQGADIRADIYSLGCTLYHLLVGRLPFPGGSDTQKRQMHRTLRPPPVQEVRPEVPDDLARVIERMLAKDPGQRYQTPAETAEALAPFTAASPSGARPQATAASSGLRRRWTVGALVCLVIAAAAGLVGWWHWGAAPLLQRGPALVPVTDALRLEGHTGAVLGLAYTPDGRLLLSAGSDGTVRVWETATGKGLHVLRGHKGLVRAVAIDRAGKLAVSAGADDRAVIVWDLTRGTEQRRFLGHGRGVTSVAFSADGRQVLSGGEDATYLWDVRTGATISKLEDPAEAVALAPKGGLAATGVGSERILQLWDLRTGRKLKAFGGYGLEVKSVIFSPDGKQVLSGSEDGSAVLWDIATGRRMQRWQHEGFVWGVDFTPDGTRALTVSWDRYAHLWNVASGEEIQRFGPAPDHLCCGAVAPVGRFAAASGGDIIYLWQLPP